MGKWISGILATVIAGVLLAIIVPKLSAPRNSPASGPGGSVVNVHPTTPSVTGPQDTLPWPSSPDCLPYNPNNLTVQYNSSFAVYQVLDGSSTLLAYKSLADANDAVKMARRYSQECFIGRTNTRTDRYSYIFDYWRGPTGVTTTLASTDCIPYDRNNLTIVNMGATGWRIRDSRSSIALFDTQADANAGLLVMRHYTHICYIGRDYSGSDRSRYITEYFT